MSKSTHQIIEEIKDAANFPHTFGATFDPQMNVADPVGDIVTLASRNIKAEDLDLISMAEFCEQYQDSVNGIYVGLFRLESQPGLISIDINIVVPFNRRLNTLRFAKSNGQESIFASHGEYTGIVVPAGGDGESRLKSIERMSAAAMALRLGKYVTVNEDGTLCLKNPNGNSGGSERCA